MTYPLRDKLPDQEAKREGDSLKTSSPIARQEIDKSSAVRARAEERNVVARFLYVSLGWCALGVGAVGVVVPLLPTTPFILLAALLFSKGSPELHEWLQNTRLAGRIIRDWEAHGVIRLRAKVISTVMMVGLISYPLIFKEMPIAFKFVAVFTMVGVLSFIWTRPSAPRV
jgi:hypothetical protein